MDGREFVRWSMKQTWERAYRGRPKGYDGPEHEKEDDKLREFGRKTVKERSKKIRAVHAARQAAKTAASGSGSENGQVDLVESTSRVAIDSSILASSEGANVDRWEPRKLVDHFVMNLPATALEFLDAFSGAYTHLGAHVGRDNLQAELNLRSTSSDSSLNPLPMIHVHCFSKDPFQPALDILNRANTALKIPLHAPYRLKAKPIAPPPQTLAGLRKSTSSNPVATYLTAHPDYPKYKSLNTPDLLMAALHADWIQRDAGLETPGLQIHYVRDVAPNKQMYCLTFPCPAQVLWAPTT